MGLSHCISFFPKAKPGDGNDLVRAVAGTKTARSDPKNVGEGAGTPDEEDSRDHEEGG